MKITEAVLSNLGYTRHQDDKPNICFYCGSNTSYSDYGPPLDVARVEELRVLIHHDFHVVTACTKCKSVLYLKRFDITSVENRRSWYSTRYIKKNMALDGIAAKLQAAQLKPWQRGIVNEVTGQRQIIDLDDFMLDKDAREAKHAYNEEQRRRGDVASPPVPEPVEPKGKDFDLGF